MTIPYADTVTVTPTDAVSEPAVVIVSGLSGAGKTAAAKLFEDLGYNVVDNLPGELHLQPCRIGFAAFYESLGRVDLTERPQRPDVARALRPGVRVRALGRMDRPGRPAGP